MNRFFLTTTALIGLACAQAASAAPKLPETSPVNLGKALPFVILSQAGITDVSASVVVGNVGTSPITGAADLLSCSEVTGRIYSVDSAGPAPCSIPGAARLTKAVGAMGTAYTDAASRAPTVTELGLGEIGGMTLTPGVYNWSSGVHIPSNIILDGNGRDVWIFQVAQDVNLDSGVSVLLRGKAQSRNIFWQVAGQVVLANSSHMEGIVLSKSMISMGNGAEIHGRLYAQTAVTLNKSTVVLPKGDLPQ